MYHEDFSMSAWQLLLVFYAICLGTMIICALFNKWLPMVDTVCAAWTAISIIVILIALSVKADVGRHSAAYTLGYYDKSLSGWGGFTFFIGLLPAAYTFSAIGMISSMAEECADPAVKVPNAISLCIPVGGVAGLFFIIPICATLPDLTDIFTNAPGGQVRSSQRSRATYCGGLGLIFLVLGITLFCSISITVAASRCTWAMARDNAMPVYHPPFVKAHPHDSYLPSPGRRTLLKSRSTPRCSRLCADPCDHHTNAARPDQSRQHLRLHRLRLGRRPGSSPLLRPANRHQPALRAQRSPSRPLEPRPGRGTGRQRYRAAVDRVRAGALLDAHGAAHHGRRDELFERRVGRIHGDRGAVVRHIREEGCASSPICPPFPQPPDYPSLPMNTGGPRTGADALINSIPRAPSIGRLRRAFCSAIHARATLSWRGCELRTGSFMSRMPEWVSFHGQCTFTDVHQQSSYSCSSCGALGKLDQEKILGTQVSLVEQTSSSDLVKRTSSRDSPRRL
nr:polyamine transporter tpo5 [Quercus suber]